ncbi:MAG TPA: hypothetical protein PKD90_07390 [Phnomibacter sp.]|nr:hypothetical protein [Phnomibacter sp.]
MPLNFPEMWLNRVRLNLTSADRAPWLDGVEELDTPVLEVGSGDASESNIIHLPTSAFEPNVLINNTTYPIALQAYSDNEVVIQLDKYQTEVTTLSDDQIVGASYRRIDVVTAKHVEAIVKKKYAKALHAFGASADTAATPVNLTTGDNVGNRKRLVYDDLVALKERLDAQDAPMEGRRLVLCTEHYNDLLLDRKNFGDRLVNYTQGQPAPVTAGFQLYWYINAPQYTVATKVKKAFGSTPAAGDRNASVVFLLQNAIKKTGMTKQYFAPAAADPQNQTNKLNYRHYFIALPVQAKHVGAIVSNVNS